MSKFQKFLESKSPIAMITSLIMVFGALPFPVLLYTKYWGLVNTFLNWVINGFN